MAGKIKFYKISENDLIELMQLANLADTYIAPVKCGNCECLKSPGYCCPFCGGDGVSFEKTKEEVRAEMIKNPFSLAPPIEFDFEEDSEY